MTIAGEIAHQFDSDGQRFKDEHGAEIDDVCRAAVINQCYAVVFGDATRYEFSDGSALVVTDCGWDLGFPAPSTCCCWAGAGEHRDECESKDRSQA